MFRSQPRAMTDRIETDVVDGRRPRRFGRRHVPAPPGDDLARAMVGAVGSQRTTRRPCFAHIEQDGDEVFSRDTTVRVVP